jgi:hypothetical protein
VGRDAAEFIPDRCYEEVAAADDIEGDSAIEQLLAELSVVDVVVRVPCDLTITRRVAAPPEAPLEPLD